MGQHLGHSSAPEAEISTKRRFPIWLWHAAVVALVGLAAWHYVDFAELARTIGKTPLEIVALLLVLATADRFLMSYKWWRLLRARKLPASFWLVVGAYYQASFVGRILPSITGDLMRGYTVTRHAGNWPVVFSSMVLEKALAIMSSTTIAAAGSIVLVGDLQQQRAIILFVAPVAFFISLLAIYISLSDQFASHLRKFIPWEKPQRYINKLHHAYSAFANEYRVLITNFILSVLENSLQVFILYVSAWAIGVNVDTWVLLAVLALSQMLRKFAIIVEGWIFGEFITVFTCALAGISPTEALAFSLLATAVTFVAITPGGVAFLVAGKMPSRKLKEHES